MDRQAIKEMLWRIRPWLRNRADDEELAAFQQAERDPELAEFKTRQEQFNARVHEALAGIPVPPTLREQVLARRKVIPVSGWRRPVITQIAAVAACVAVLATFIVLTFRPAKEDTTFAGFRQRMVGFALREYRMDTNTTSLAELKNYLASQHRPADFPLPSGLRKVPLKGGASLSWQTRPVSMVCFDWVKRQTLYMFVMDQADGAGAAPEKPEVRPYKGLSTASWESGGKTFLLAAKVPEEVMQTFVSGARE